MAPGGGAQLKSIVHAASDRTAERAKLERLEVEKQDLLRRVRERDERTAELSKQLSLTTLGGREIVIGGAHESGLASFILFISPTCPVCKSLVPTAQSLVKSEGGRMQLIFASDGDELDQHRSYANDLKLDAYPYILSEELGRTFEVSKLPFAVLIAADGTLKAKGLVNTREHMESLIESMDTGITSVQEYVGLAQSAGDSPAESNPNQQQPASASESSAMEKVS